MFKPIAFFASSLLIISCGQSDSSNEKTVVTDTLEAVTTHRVTPTAPTTDSSSIAESGNNSPRKANGTVRLVVSFISQGEGIDHTTKDSFDAWLKTKGAAKAEISSWGREGELNYCFALANMTIAEQDKFVEEVRTKLTGRKMVHINENTNCDNWK